LVEQLREAAIIKRSHDLVVAPKCGLVLARRSALNQAVDRAIAGILKILPAIRACRAHRADEFIVQERVRHSQAQGMAVIEEFVDQLREALIVERTELPIAATRWSSASARTPPLAHAVST